MNLIIQSQRRDVFGKNASYRIRKTGQIPAILYGEGLESVPLILAKTDVIQILKSESGLNTLFRVAIDHEERDVMIKDLQVDPTTDELLHADLIQIAMDKLIRVNVPIELQGEPVGVKTEGGFVDFMTRELSVECLPAQIPDHLSVDISALHLHQSLKASDVFLPEGLRLLTDSGTVIVLVQVPHEEKVPVAAAEAEVAAEAAPAEPEVIKKERAEKEPEGEK